LTEHPRHQEVLREVPTVAALNREVRRDPTVAALPAQVAQDLHRLVPLQVHRVAEVAVEALQVEDDNQFKITYLNFKNSF
jgi:hypothetical protein